jgi:hypothetical protein
MLEQTDCAARMPRAGVPGRPAPEPGDADGHDRGLVRDANRAADEVSGPGRGDLPGLAPERLSHELRTPLNAILGNAELLLDGSAGPLSSEARGCLADIQAAGQRMLRQVQVLLDLCHARARPTLTDERALDLIELVRAAHAAARAPEAGPVLEVVPADGRYVVCGDAAWLGALALALVEIHRGDGQRRGPLRITTGGRSPLTSATALGLWWLDFAPDQVAALPIALIDAILDLHGGVVALTRDGLHLDWPAARVVQVGPPAAGWRVGAGALECC